MEINVAMIIFFLLLIALSLLTGFVIIDAIYQPSLDEICQSIGMKSSRVIRNNINCMDYDNNFYPVDIICNGRFAWNKNCTAELE